MRQSVLMPRVARVAKNQALRRVLNENIGEAAAHFTDPSDRPEPLFGFFCECGTRGCSERVSMTAAEYGCVGVAATTFVVVPGHEIVSIERVVERTPRFFIVQEFDSESPRVAADQNVRQARRVRALAVT